MPVPKHKVAKCKSRMRRSNSYYKVETKSLSVCPQCGAKKLPHRICPECGYYKGKLVVAKAIKEEK